MRTIHREVVAGMILAGDGKILLTKKNSKGGGVYIDSWHIPGGGVEEGETLEQALRREMQEEIGIDITPYEITLIDDTGKGTSEKTLKDTGEKVMVDMHFHVFQVLIFLKSTDIPIILDEENEAYQWCLKEDLSTIKLTPPSLVLFKKLGYMI